MASMAGGEGFRGLLQEVFSPVVAVISSPEADAITETNDGLTLAELFRPFGQFHNLNSGVGVPVRTVGDTSYRVHHIQLRFHAEGTLRQPDAESADSYLAGVLSDAAERHRHDPVPDLKQELDNHPDGVDVATPWFDSYRTELLRMLQFNPEVQPVDVPVACMLVLPSTVEDPVGEFHALAAGDRASGRKHSPMVAAALEEPKLPRHYVLVHDHLQDGEDGAQALKRAEDKVRLCKAAFGMTACHLLRLHTPVEDDVKDAQRGAVWKRHIRKGVPGVAGAGEPASRPPEPPNGLGAALSAADLALLHQVVEEMTVRCLLPSLEQRIRALNFQVSSTRKGLRNQLKTLLWRKSASDGSSGADSSGGGGLGGGGGGVMYEAGSVEWQMQQLAVLAFHVQDWDTCASTLRLASGDYKQDKAWRHYAAAQELLGVALYLGGGMSAEAASHLKEAFARYSSAAGPSAPREFVRYATRSMVLLAEMDRECGCWAEANFALMKAHYQEDNLRAALLLEQAACCLLHTTPPATRKFAFHMVLAGLRYNNSHQRPLSMRSYRLVASLYRSAKWDLIDEHIHDILGKQCRDTGDSSGAVTHFMSMLHCPATSLHWQQQYLQQFMEAVLQAAEGDKGAPPVLPLPLPVIDKKSVSTRCGSHTCFADEASRQVPEETWLAMEGALSGNTGAEPERGPNWLDAANAAAASASGSRPSMAMAASGGSCMAGEEVLVDIEMSNPLQLPLECAMMRLVVEHSADGGQPSGSGGGDADEAGGSSSGGSGSSGSTPSVQISDVDVALAPGSTQRVTLRATPTATGILTVRGVEWLLQGVARGRMDFEPPRARHHGSSARNGARPRSRASSVGGALAAAFECRPGLVLEVLPAMPRLEVLAVGLSPHLASGQLHAFRVRLRNCGNLPLRGIEAVVGSPDVYCAPGTETGGGNAAADGDGGGTSSSNNGSRDGSFADASAEGGGGGSGDDRANGGGPASTSGSSDTLQGDGWRGGVRVSDRNGFQVAHFGSGLQLEPGGQVEWPLYMLPRFPGQMSFQLAWRYEAVAAGSNGGSAAAATGAGGGGLPAKARVLRSTFDVFVAPSLVIAAVLEPCAAATRCGILTLRMQNDYPRAALRVRQVSCLTPGMSLSPVSASARPGLQGSASAEDDITIAPLSRANRFIYLTTESSGDGGADSAAASPPVPPGEAPLISPTDRAVQHFYASHRTPAALAAVSGTAADGNLLDSCAAGPDLMIAWEATTADQGSGSYSAAAGASSAATTITGWHFLYNVQTKDDAPVRVSAAPVQHVVDHDFHAPGGGICTALLRVTVENCRALPVSVCIETGVSQPPAGGGISPRSPGGLGSGRSPRGSSSGGSRAASRLTSTSGAGSGHIVLGSAGSAGGGGGPGAGRMEPQPARQYIWCGRTHCNLAELGPGQSACVDLAAAFFCPGVYELADYTVSWTHAGDAAGGRSDVHLGPPVVMQVAQQQQQV